MSKPSHILKVKHKDSQYDTRVGAAWPTKNGNGLNIRLDAGVAVFGGPDIYLTLWPNEERQQSGGRGDYGGGAHSGHGGGGSDDDVPFAAVDERVH